MILAASVQRREGHAVRAGLTVAVLEAGLAGHLGLVDLNDQIANDGRILAGAIDAVAHLGGTGGRGHVVAHSHGRSTGQLLIVENRDGRNALHISSQQRDHRLCTFSASGEGKAARSRRITSTQRHALNIGIQRTGRQLDIHRGLAFLHRRDVKVLRGGQGAGLVMQHLGVVQQRKKIQIRLVGCIGDLNGLGRINGRLRQSGPAVVDVDLLAIDGKTGLRSILQTGALAVRTLEGYVGDVNNIAARLLQQLGSDRLIPPSSSQTVIL